MNIKIDFKTGVTGRGWKVIYNEILLVRVDEDDEVMRNK